jgi:hypothetical protein
VSWRVVEALAAACELKSFICLFELAFMMNDELEAARQCMHMLARPLLIGLN